MEIAGKCGTSKVLTLQQIVLSKNFGLVVLQVIVVLTLQQIVLSKNQLG